MTAQDIVLLAAGVILPIACVLQVFLSRSRVYAAWTKLAVIIICLAGLAWGILDWVLLQRGDFRLTHEAYDKLHVYGGSYSPGNVFFLDSFGGGGSGVNSITMRAL